MELIARPSPYTGKTGKPWFDVTRYGAKGDGVTDDKAAILAAITAAALVNGVVFFPAKTFLIGSAIALPACTAVVLRGSEGTFFTVNGNYKVFTCANANATYFFYNMQFNGNGAIGSIFCEVNAVNVGFYFDWVNVLNFEKSIIITGANSATCDLNWCHWNVASIATASHFESATIQTGVANLTNCFMADYAAGERGGFVGQWYVNAYGSQLNLRGGGAFTTSAFFGCTFNTGEVQLLNATKSKVIGCFFLTIGTGQARWLYIQSGHDNAEVSGCTFGGAPSTEMIKLSASSCSISGCVFVSSSSIKTVAENGTPDNNRIDGCVGLGSGGGMTILGASTRVDGVQAGNSTGAGSVAEPVGGLSSQFGDAASINGTNDLHTYTVPANVLEKAGRRLKLRLHGTTANNANAKTINVLFGGTTIMTLALTISQVNEYIIDIDIVKVSGNVQRIEAEIRQYGTANQFKHTLTPGAITDTAGIILKSQAVALAASDIVEKLYLLEVC